MPPRKEIKTLKLQCMLVASKNLFIFSTQELQNLPWDLSEELNQFLYNDQEKHICLTNRIRLIKANVRKLSLSFPYQWEQLSKFTLSIILKMCKSLTEFTCDDTGTLTHQDFLQFVGSIPNMAVLKIANAKLINDDMIEAIGNSCPKLENLTLFSCKITDDGIRRFSLSKSGGCNMQFLKFEFECEVTAQGCLTALHSFKNLKVFDYYEVISAFTKLFQDSNGSRLPEFQLCELPQVELNMIPNGTLNFIMRCCPNLSGLTLFADDHFAHNFNELKNCKEIVPFGLFLRFGQLAPSDLINFGSKLTQLELSETTIHLESIGYGCPNLTKLSLCQVLYLTGLFTVDKNCQTPFSKLQTLVLASYKSLPIATPKLKFLLANCLDLEELTIGYHTTLTDDVMIRVLHGTNPLKRLINFGISNCHKVSKMSILELLQLENDLKLIVIEHCANITVDDFGEIQNFIKENNYSISLKKHWCSCEV